MPSSWLLVHADQLRGSCGRPRKPLHPIRKCSRHDFCEQIQSFFWPWVILGACVGHIEPITELRSPTPITDVWSKAGRTTYTILQHRYRSARVKGFTTASFISFASGGWRCGGSRDQCASGYSARTSFLKYIWKYSSAWSFATWETWPPSINTAPSTIPTLPQASAQSQQITPSARPSAGGHAHSYSLSSPAGMDQQKYVPFINTPESSKYASTPTHKYTSSQMPPGESPYSPLGLADIRPLADQGMGDGPSSANPYSNDSFPSIPTKSNYLAPWAVYAFDWCKWPVQQQNSNDGGGKMAIGSYVEDGHNFVSQLSLPGHNGQNSRKEDPLMHELDPNT